MLIFSASYNLLVSLDFLFSPRLFNQFFRKIVEGERGVGLINTNKRPPAPVTLRFLKKEFIYQRFYSIRNPQTEKGGKGCTLKKSQVEHLQETKT